MNKKLVKNRVSRTNTLEAMACECGCTDNNCKWCSAGGSFHQTEKTNTFSVNFRVIKRDQ